MEIYGLQINHLKNPLGYSMDAPVVSWRVKGARGKRQAFARIEITNDGKTVYACEGADLSPLGHKADFAPEPRALYGVSVTVRDEEGDEARGSASFETGKRDEKWEAQWIRAPYPGDIHPLLYRRFALPNTPVKARAYVCGLGLYEFYVNGQKAGDEYLAPFCNDYGNWLQAQTYDITKLLRAGENEVCAMLGNGWYSGRFGFGDERRDLFGKDKQLICEVRAAMEDGAEITIPTGLQWQCGYSPVAFSNIYDGEHQDARIERSDPVPAVAADAPKAPLCDRMSPPVHITETRKPVSLLLTKKGERVLDFGQVMTGWVETDCDLPAGAEIRLQYGELLQDECFYTENLRTAKQEFRYLSDGKFAHVRPHFTFYGFRYVKVEGISDPDPKAFTACVLHSDLERTGSLETDNPKVNRLIENAMWSQRGNFLDVPTDCPQRDERMGWTGDAQVFAPTACFHMNTAAFYDKYLHDMLLEQRLRSGAVPHVVPDVLSLAHLTSLGENAASCGWADSACVIPWTLYRFYGDKSMLARHYENMRLWADYIHSRDTGDYLWHEGFHFADWLALDNPVRGSSFGGTDPYFIASAYYYYSTLLTAKAAAALNLEADREQYSARAESIKAAIRCEYFTGTGRIAVPTQTAMALSLSLDLVPNEHRKRISADLKARIEARGMHLDTGFIGTYFLLPALSENGMHDIAVTLLLNEDYPGWLYEVNMGATTIWERWNSVMPNGLVSDTGMNSMNHYAYGAVVEWIYRSLCGLRTVEGGEGFVRAQIAPMIDGRFGSLSAAYRSAAGDYRVAWTANKDGAQCIVTVPFNAQAEFIVPDGYTLVLANGMEASGRRFPMEAGEYAFILIKINDAGQAEAKAL